MCYNVMWISFLTQYIHLYSPLTSSSLFFFVPLPSTLNIKAVPHIYLIFSPHSDVKMLVILESYLQTTMYPFRKKYLFFYEDFHDL